MEKKLPNQILGRIVWESHAEHPGRVFGFLLEIDDSDEVPDLEGREPLAILSMVKPHQADVELLEALGEALEKWLVRDMDSMRIPKSALDAYILRQKN